MNNTALKADQHPCGKPLSSLTEREIKEILHASQIAGKKAAENFMNEHMDSCDRGACGFAWLTLNGIKGNTKLGRLLKRCGIEQNWERKFWIWNPAQFPVQSVDILSAGAYAAAEVWRKHGFDARAASRLD